MRRLPVSVAVFGLLVALSPATAQTPESRAEAATSAPGAAASAVVAGRVTAGAAPVAGASVYVPGTLDAAVTGEDGAYVLDVSWAGTGTTEVAAEVRFAGYRAVQRRVRLVPGDTVRLDVALDRLPFWARLRVFGERLRFGTAAREAFGTARRVDAETTVEGVVVEAPARTIEALAALAPSVIRDDRTDSLDVRGVVPTWTLDGIALPRGARLPLGLVAAADVQPGALRAGDAAGQGGRLDLTSRDGRSGRTLRVDARGGIVGAERRWADVGGQAAGTALRERVRVAAGLRTVRTDDPSPSARPLPRLTDDAIDRLRASPQLLRIENPDGSVRFVPLGSSAAGSMLSAFAPGVDPARVSVVDAISQLTDADLTTSSVRRGASLRSDEGFVRVGLVLPFALDADVLHARTTQDGERYSAAAALLEPGQARTAETTVHSRLRLSTRRLGLDLSGTLARTTLRRTDYRDGFGRDVRATLAYADIDDPRNETARAYVRLQPLTSSSRPPTADSTLLQTYYSDSSLPSGIGVYGLYALPGALTTGYATGESATTTARLDAARRWGRDGQSGSHRLDVGADAEQTVERAFSITPTGARRLAQRYADTPGSPSGRLVCDYDNTGQECLSSFDDFTYADLFDYTRFVGYRYNGLGRTNPDGGIDDIEAYVACAKSSIGCADGPEEAPARATRFGGWASDRAVFGPLVVDAGLRVDVFGRGGVALVDPYSLLPIVRAGDAGLASARIGDDWAVYYNGATVTGFRDLNGQFYRPDGSPAESPNEVIVNVAVRPRMLDPQAGNVLDARVFRAPRTHVVWQPRVAASLAVGADASLFAYAASTAEAAPSGLAHVSMTTYRYRLEGAGDAGNPDLAPMRTSTFGLGGRGGIDRLALSAELWLAHDTGLPVGVLRRNVFPGNYGTVESRGDRRRWGAEVAGEWLLGARTRLALSYALTSGGDVVIFDWGRLREASPEPPIRAAARRHSGLARLVTSTGSAAGPAFGPIRPFADWALDAALVAASGRPYARLVAPYPLSMPVRLTGYRSTATMPPSVRLDLALARTLVRTAGGRADVTLRAENVLGRRNVRRVWNATGLPDEDGYLATDAGRFEYPPGSVENRLYQARLVDPTHYGLGRIVHIGLRWTQ